MEGTGDESLSPHVAVPEAADGGIGLAADVVGMLFHGVFLLPGIGRRFAYSIVGSDAAGDLANVPHPRQVDGSAVDSIGGHCSDESGSGLLALLSEVAW